MNTLEWSQECTFISATVDKVCAGAPVPNDFNGDIACLARYVDMQAASANREGFYDASTYIQHCADDLLLYRLNAPSAT